MKLQVVVNKLNRRKSPVTDFADKSNVVDVVKNGFVFESVAQIENKLGVWHQDSDGFWASEKWLTSAVAVNVAQYMNDRFDGTNIKELIDYNFLLNIPQALKNTNGKDSVIAILDQPISTNMSFENMVRPGNILTNNSPSNHGNFIAGFVGCKTTSTIQGICSMGTIVDLTYKDASGSLITDDDYYDKLVACVNSFGEKMVIISVSRSLDDSLQFAIEKFTQLTNVFFVCSAGTDTELLNVSSSALMDNMKGVTVGSASIEFLNSNAAQIDKKLDILIPVVDYVSFNSDGLTFSKIPDTSSSWATAVVSSLVALLFSNNEISIHSTKADIVAKIEELAQEAGSASNFLNPLKF